jgi:hypothetical protein
MAAPQIRHSQVPSAMVTTFGCMPASSIRSGGSQSNTDVGRLAGQPVRLRFELKGADPYWLPFAGS